MHETRYFFSIVDTSKYKRMKQESEGSCRCGLKEEKKPLQLPKTN